MLQKRLNTIEKNLHTNTLLLKKLIIDCNREISKFTLIAKNSSTPKTRSGSKNSSSSSSKNSSISKNPVKSSAKPIKTKVSPVIKEAKVPESIKTPKAPLPFTSFKFRVFFNKKDNEKSILQKNDKIIASLYTYLNHRKFSEYLMKIVDNTTDIKPIQLEVSTNFEDKATYFNFNIYSPNLNDTNLGPLIQNIQEKFFQAENAGLFKNFVYVV